MTDPIEKNTQTVLPAPDVPPVPAEAIAVEPVDVPHDELTRAIANQLDVIHSGARWFHSLVWFSLVSILLTLFGSPIILVGISISIDLAGVMRDHDAEPAVKTVCMVIALLFVGLFYLFGHLGLKRKQGALITGFVLYLLDALLALPDLGRGWGFIDLGFHGWVCYNVFLAIKANAELKKLERSVAQARRQETQQYGIPTMPPPPPYQPTIAAQPPTEELPPPPPPPPLGQ